MDAQQIRDNWALRRTNRRSFAFPAAWPKFIPIRARRAHGRDSMQNYVAMLCVSLPLARKTKKSWKHSALSGNKSWSGRSPLTEQCRRAIADFVRLQNTSPRCLRPRDWFAIGRNSYLSIVHRFCASPRCRRPHRHPGTRSRLGGWLPFIDEIIQHDSHFPGHTSYSHGSQSLGLVFLLILMLGGV